MRCSISGSTNAVIHLTAIAGRLGISLPLEQLNRLAAETPVLVNLKPVGTRYMEDFHAAGGLPAVLRELRPLLHLDCVTVTGETLGQLLDRPERPARDPAVIASRQSPIDREGGLVALFGSLAPGGALLKRAAADAALFEHEGRAVVFDSLDDLAARIDEPDLDVEPEDILVLRNAGPNSPAAMPEAGYLPIPRKLAGRGVKDMIRISDARMSGTAFGTVILHVAPEAAKGGPLAVVQSGDRIRLSVGKKRVDLLVDEATLTARRMALPRPDPIARRGYDWLYHAHVLQATEGCDFDFMLPTNGSGPDPIRRGEPPSSSP
jgi:dihydroxy-acid dehydratase